MYICISTKLFGHQKVSILNGGLSTWIRSGYKLSNKLPDLPVFKHTHK